jgi:hypothetical protein
MGGVRIHILLREGLAPRITNILEEESPLFGRAECHDAPIFPCFVRQESQGVTEFRPPEEGEADGLPFA